jgi:glycosyltransferase involved in cell wall biosynthesis
MDRRITPLKDVLALIRLIALLRQIRPDILHAHTPKGGLLSMIAGWLTGVPVRIYQVHGLPMATASWPRRELLRVTERISCFLSHRVLCVSQSIWSDLVDAGLCSADRAKVLLGGSVNGLDSSVRFNPDRYVDRSSVRAKLGIPVDALVVGFAGRIAREKGIGELVEAWKMIRDEFPGAYLLVVGPPEPLDPIGSTTDSALRTDPRAVLTGMIFDMAPIYSAMDVLALPTYREGLPTVLLEASAMALPIVASRVAGCVDIVEDGETGLLIDAKDVHGFAEALRTYLRNPDLRREHGCAARTSIVRRFNQQAIWNAILDEYSHLLRERS